MGFARFQPALVVALLLGAAGVLNLEASREAFGIAADDSMVRALVYCELALPLLMFVVPPVAARKDALLSALWAAACFGAASAVISAFSFVGAGSLALGTRGLASCAWAAACGVACLGAALESRFGGPWQMRLRIGWLCLSTLPVLWHYFALEYAAKSLLHLRSLSAHWLLAAFPNAGWERFAYWPLAVIGGGTWLAALALTRERKP